MSPPPAARKLPAGRALRVVAGVDPGLARTGFAVIAGHGEAFEVVTSGVIATRPEQPEAERLRVLYDRLLQTFRRHRPAVVVVERLFFNKNARSALSVGQARGVALLAAARAGARVAEVTPQQVKSCVTGMGSGDKGQVAFMVQRLLGMARRPHPDEADALAVALWGALGEDGAR